jgi:hypothetical protein
MSTENPTYLDRALEAGAAAHGAVYDANGGGAMTAELVGAVVGAVEDFIREDERRKVEAAHRIRLAENIGRIEGVVQRSAHRPLLHRHEALHAALLAALNASPETQETCERCKGSGTELYQGCGEWLSEECPVAAVLASLLHPSQRPRRVIRGRVRMAGRLS